MDLSIKELNELIYSLGMASTKGMMCDKQLNASLLDKLYEELNSKLKRQANITDEVIDRVKSAAQRYSDEVRVKHTHIEDFTIEATTPKFRGEGTTQALLDYVDMKGVVTHKELHEYYKSLNGSNTFSWCLRNLRIPYKNRKTQRYLAKTDNGKYVVRMANSSNWIVKEY